MPDTAERNQGGDAGPGPASGDMRADGFGIAYPARPDLIERLDRLLPQTQCGQCGYPGCRPYAEAMARGEAGIDHCPPGGDAGARARAALLGVAPRPYDRSRGIQAAPHAVRVVEADCNGCTKSIKACPVDAIIGAAKHMHVVIEPLCTGCDLCLPACPVDCIVAVPATA